MSQWKTEMSDPFILLHTSIYNHQGVMSMLKTNTGQITANGVNIGIYLYAYCNSQNVVGLALCMCSPCSCTT